MLLHFTCIDRMQQAAHWSSDHVQGRECLYLCAELLTCSIVSVEACTEATGWFMTAAAAAWAAALAALAAAAAALDATSPPRGMVGGMVAPATQDNKSAACLIQTMSHKAHVTQSTT